MTRNRGDSKALSCNPYGPAEASCISPPAISSRSSAKAAREFRWDSPMSKCDGSARYQAHPQIAQLCIIGGDDLLRGLAAAAPGAVGVRDQRGVEAQRCRPPAGGIDTIVGLGPRDDQLVDAAFRQHFAQLGIVKGIRRPLLD